MTRVDFLLPEPDAVDRTPGLRLQPGPEREGEVVLYDTFDGRLWDRRSLLMYDSGVLRLGSEELTVGSEPERVLAATLPAGPLRDRLSELAEMRAVLPQVRLAGTARELRVLNADEKTITRIEVRVPAVVSGAAGRIPLSARAHVRPLRGYERETEEVLAILRERFAPCQAPLYQEAMVATGRSPNGVSSKIKLKLAGDQRTDAAAAAVLRALLGVIEANLAGTIADTDSEFLHDFRVAVRRSRSVQRELKNAFPPSDLARHRTEFRWLQRVTGDARDLDVYVLEFSGFRELLPESIADDLEPLLAVLRDRRLAARREMVRSLRGQRFSRLLSDWAALLEELVELPTEDRPAALRPIDEVVGERIVKVYRRMVKMGKAIDRSSPAENFHDLRKKGKELRYLLELFGGPLFDPDVVKPMVKALKALQDVLGRHQDREVQIATLHSLRDSVAARPGGPAALMAMGVLVERLREDEAAARGEFAKRFATFASRSQRRAVKRTFRR